MPYNSWPEDEIIDEEQLSNQFSENRRDTFDQLINFYDNQSSLNYGENMGRPRIHQEQKQGINSQTWDGQNPYFEEFSQNDISKEMMTSEIKPSKESESDENQTFQKSPNKKHKTSSVGVNNKQKGRKEKLINKQSNIKSKEQISKTLKKKRQQYITKNFLPAFRLSHLKLIKQKAPNIYENDQRLKMLREKGKGINMNDYVYMYKLECMKEHWEMYFAQKRNYQDFMNQSRVIPANKIIFEKYIYRFQEVFRSGVFDHIAQF